MDTPAGRFDRAEALDRLASETFDLVVVGGGITGAGVALDAAARGLSVALVERGDFASGTSSRSSKLVHGGLRYLRSGEVRLVYEALDEREILRRNAPHLVHPLPFLIPVMASGDSPVDKRLARAMGAALWAYDLTGGLRSGTLHRRVSREEALRLVPALDAGRVRSAYLYHDAQTDDARLTLTVLRTAALRYGAAVANRTTVVGFGRGGGGRIDRVQVRAAAGAGGGNAREIEVQARAVVNATGIWADQISRLEDQSSAGDAAHDHIRPAKGVHLTVPNDRLRHGPALVLPVPKDRRSIFVIPWDGHTVVGTTDTDYQGSLDEPDCTADDVRYLLDAVNASLTSELSPADVTGTWAGLRPLVGSAADSEKTQDLSRRHRVSTGPGGMVTVTGGKLTTYRRMAADTVRAVLESAPGTGAFAGARRRSPTRHVKLWGAPLASDGRATRPGSAADRHLEGRFGTDASRLLALVAADSSLGQPLVEGLPYLRAEVVFAAREEMAGSVDDVLTRRTRARLLVNEAAAKAAPDVAALLAAELGWDTTTEAAEVASFQAACAAERRTAGI